MNPFTDPEVDETAPTMEMPLRPRTGTSTPHQSNTTPTSSTAPQNHEARIAELEKELAESKRREEALTTHYEARETAAAAFVNDIVDATNQDTAMADGDYGDYR